MSFRPQIVCVTDPLGPGAGAATLAACAQAVRALEEKIGAGRVEVGVLGTNLSTQLAVECGLAPAWRVPIPCGNVRLAEPALSRVLNHSTPSVVLAWGARAAQLVSRTMRDTPLVVVMDAPFESKSVIHAELAEVLCMGDLMADHACALGWLPIRIRTVLPAMPSWQQDPSHDRNSLRRQWGATDQDCVMGVLPVSSGRADALFAFHAMGRVAFAGHGAHLVLDPNLGNASGVRSIARKLDLNARVHFDSALSCPWKLCSAIDVWMSLRDAHVDETSMHHSCAAALGAPLVAQSGSFAAACIEHQVDGIVAGEGVNALAFEILQIAKNPAQIGAMATSGRVKYGAKNVRDGFALAIQECVGRVCPEVFAVRESSNFFPADTKFAAAST
ncbi:MAG: hypothetical protein WCP80_04780 [Phycisphaerales bacterium]